MTKTGLTPLADEATVKATAKSIDPLPALTLEVPAVQHRLRYEDDDEWDEP